MTVLKPSKLTVRIIKRKLGDHFLDFMNAHNSKGYLPDEDKEIDEHSISGILIYTALSPALTVSQFRNKSRAIVNQSGIKMNPNFARYALANALGYVSYRAATEARKRDEANRFVNARLTVSTIALDIHGTEKAGHDLLDWPLDKPLPHYIHAMNVKEGVATPPARMKGERAPKKFPKLDYEKYVELTEQLRDAFPRTAQRLERKVLDYMRNVLPHTDVVWVTYDQGRKGRYITRSAWRRLDKLFRNAGGLKALHALDPSHPLVADYVVELQKREAAVNTPG